MRYAQSTTVPVEKTKADIERTLINYGATGFVTGWNQEQAVLSFELSERHIKFVLPLPDINKAEFQYKTKQSYSKLPKSQVQKRWEQACRQRWRALLLCIKSKLEAVQCGIATFDEEFLAHIVMPHNKQTVGSVLIPQLAESYKTGGMPPLLGGPR